MRYRVRSGATPRATGHRDCRDLGIGLRVIAAGRDNGRDLLRLPGQEREGVRIARDVGIRHLRFDFAEARLDVAQLLKGYCVHIKEKPRDLACARDRGVGGRATPWPGWPERREWPCPSSCPTSA